MSYSIDWGQFLLQAWPTLLIYLAGFVIALTMMGRHRIPALLVLIAMVLLIVATFLPLFTGRLVSSSRGSSDSIRQGYVVMGMVYAIIRAIAVGLLVWAAFAGRPRNYAMGHGFGVMPPQYPPGPQYQPVGQYAPPPPPYGSAMPHSTEPPK